MEIKRTANAGVLLKMDGVSILLDGICKSLFPYEETPATIKDEFLVAPPDIMAFTHEHIDHFDKDYIKNFNNKVLRPSGSENLLCNIGNISIEGIVTRHIGKFDISHVSYVIKGSKTVWFMGDASPLILKKFKENEKPDVLIAPYAYANTPYSWKASVETGAEKIVILHLPKKENDSLNLRDAIINVTNQNRLLHLPEIGDIITID